MASQQPTRLEEKKQAHLTLNLMSKNHITKRIESLEVDCF